MKDHEKLIINLICRYESNYIGDFKTSLIRNNIWKAEPPAKKNQHTKLFSASWSTKTPNKNLKSMENKIRNETR